MTNVKLEDVFKVYDNEDLYDKMFQERITECREYYKEQCKKNSLADDKLFSYLPDVAEMNYATEDKIHFAEYVSYRGDGDYESHDYDRRLFGDDWRVVIKEHIQSRINVMMEEELQKERDRKQREEDEKVRTKELIEEAKALLKKHGEL